MLLCSWLKRTALISRWGGEGCPALKVLAVLQCQLSMLLLLLLLMQDHISQHSLLLLLLMFNDF